jgi:hypothetical protein
MKCPTCGADYEQGQANGDNGASMGMAKEGDLFARVEPRQRNVAVAKGNGGNRRSRLGPDWQPTQAQRTYCERQGKDPDSFLQAFKGYYEAKGSQWLNWGKVWEKACREWQGHVGLPQAAQQNGTSLQDQALNLWKLRLTSKHWNPFWGPRIGEPGCQVPKELLP